jgi:YggT family protein|tara:strand:+ start:462 stop:728 length:267 start_codon:yes stop_codon:yes gene_type:complete
MISVFLNNFLGILIEILYLAILARVILSWIPVRDNKILNSILKVVYAITEPILVPIKKVLPSTGMFDFSPMVALVLIIILQNIVNRLL